MANVLDVAEKILVTKGATDTFSLQKLVYYSYACHLATRGQPLFDSRIEAWINGPAIPALYSERRGMWKTSTVDGDPLNLNADEVNSIETALVFYGDHDASWLVDQTHMEPPWLEAREGLEPHERGHRQITDEALSAYFGGIFNDSEVLRALIDAKSDPGLTSADLLARYSE